MLSASQLHIIRDLQLGGIQQKQLLPAHLDLIHQSNWFNLWVPEELNGLNMDLPEGLKLLNELAYADGGLAWTITLCAGANMFAGFIDPELAASLWEDPKICLGGSGAVGGKAVFEGDSYVISGFWKYATGAPHLQYFTLNAEVWQDGQLCLTGDGEPQIKSFLVPRDQVLIHYDWDTFGLECTASHSFSIDQVRVPASNSFELKPELKTVDSPLFRIPFMAFAELTLLVNYMGIFERFCDLLEKVLFAKSGLSKEKDALLKKKYIIIDEARQYYSRQKENLLGLSDSIWDSVVKDVDIEKDLLDMLAIDSRTLVKWMRLQVADLIPLAGIQAAQRENELNVVFRNFFTATQHSLLNG